MQIYLGIATLSGGDLGELYIWAIQPHKKTYTLSVVNTLNYSPDGTLLATADDHGNVMLWDMAGGTLLKQFDELVVGPVFLEFLPDGCGLVLGYGDGTLTVLRVQ